jgi:DNA-binding SARP family transcriptional activator/tetratricopeptide (TPR) repeat protein
MEFRILGPLEVRDDGRALDVGGAKQRSLLAVLLLNANQVVSTDRLIDALWGEQPPETAGKAIQIYVSQLRRVLGKERLETTAPGYLLRVDDDELDLHRFETLLEQSKETDTEAASAKLRAALALWRGRPLEEFAYEPFAQLQIGRLEELQLACIEKRVDADLACGRHPELVGELEALVAEHRLRERLRGQLMLALYRSGRQAEALAAYQEARQVLVEELGIEPGKSLRELEKAILRQDSVLDVASASTERAKETDASRGVFVGRESELAELRAGLDEAIAGRGGLYLLVGEPGIGKSRLADELIRSAQARGAQVLVGRCWEAGGAPAYWPWVQSIRAHVRATEPGLLRSQLGAGAAELAQLLPELHELFPNLPEPPALESEGARFSLFEAASSLLTSAAQARPLVLFLDDLHAADEPSLLLLQFLARELGESRLLLVGAYRNVDPSPTDPLTIALTELAREPVTRSIALAGLGEREVARFIELTSGEAPSEELVVTIHEETEGNPLFVGEIVRLLAAEGGLDAREAPRLAIPQSVRDVIARRLRHLSENCNQVLVLASVLGREFGLVTLARLGRVPEVELLDTLDEAMAARVVSDVPGSPGHLRFAHVLIRDTLYEGLTTVRRVRLHRLVVEALEALYGEEPGPHLAELAHHAIAGGDFEKGLRYARRAGDRALTLLAYEEATRLYETALEALDPSGTSDETARCGLLLSLGEAKIRAGDSPTAKKAFLDAAEIAQRLGLARELARAAAGYGGRIMYARAGGDDRLVPLLEEGLAELDDEDVELRVRLLARLAGALRDEHSRDRRDTLSREAVELARRSGNPRALAYALDGRAAAILAPDTVVECLTLGSELCKVAERIGDKERVVHGHWHRMIAEGMVGDIRDAELDIAAGSHIAEELRQPAQLWGLWASQAMHALAAGRLTGADELVAKAFAFGERAQPEMAIPVYRLQKHTLCEFRGGLEEIEPAIRDLVAEYPARLAFRCLLAHLWAQLGRMQEARRVFEELATNDFAALPFDMEWLLGMSLLAETSSLLADTDSARVLYELLLPWKAFNVADHPEAMRGSVSRYLGILASALQHFDEAEPHFEKALETNARMGARPWLAHTQRDYARMLLARNAGGDQEKAQQLLSQALMTYRELGMSAGASASAPALDAEPAAP